MGALHPNLRKKLEKTVIQARQIAEKAAESALKALAVDNHQPFEHMTPELREFRNKLRSHGRAIGDIRRPKGDQDIYHLIIETAYQHWHRMLFARFLAENNLLMHPDGVAVTLDECEELATEEGTGKWVLASRYASTMLPAIFRQNDPTLQLEFAPEYKLELEKVLSELESEIFHADDSLGWVYQFWQAKKKDEVNASEKKIGADELPAVTQLFTEDYMVKFLLQNSLGAWWAEKFLQKHPQIAQNKELTEDDLRKVVAFDDYSLDFLRFIFDDDNKAWKPAAGCFEGWPKEAKDITILDPSCGSGHFLVAAFELMVRIRIVEEELSVQDAINAVLKDNIFGLEIDTRCTQIAAFLVALSAWTYPGAEGYHHLPGLNIACSGIPVTAKKEDWLKLAIDDKRIIAGLDRLWELFHQAPILGSLVEPTSGIGAFQSTVVSDIIPILKNVLSSETHDDEFIESAVAAQGVAKAASMLSNQYILVITNVPYLARGKQEKELQDFSELYHYDGKTDLATTMISRCRNFCKTGATYAIVSPQSWLVQHAYSNFRNLLLSQDEYKLIAKLGPRAFETISGEVVNVSNIINCKNTTGNHDTVNFVDVENGKSPSEKNRLLKIAQITSSSQTQLLSNKSHIISPVFTLGCELLELYATSYQGIKSGDDGKLRRKFWELPNLNKSWRYEQSTTNTTRLFGGREHIIWWEYNHEFARFQGQNGWGKNGVIINQMGSLPSTLHTGNPFDGTVACLIPTDQNNLPAIWMFCSSSTYSETIREIDSSLGVANSMFVRVPFDLKYWQELAIKKYPNGLPDPYSDDPTQWIFKGIINETTEPLQVATSRLLGYSWPDQKDLPEFKNIIDEDGIVCMRGKFPEALIAFERFRSIQSGPYVAYPQWTENINDAGETIRATMIDTRIKGICEYSEFKEYLNIHKKRFLRS